MSDKFDGEYHSSSNIGIICQKVTLAFFAFLTSAEPVTSLLDIRDGLREFQYLYGLHGIPIFIWVTRNSNIYMGYTEFQYLCFGRFFKSLPYWMWGPVMLWAEVIFSGYLWEHNISNRCINSFSAVISSILKVGFKLNTRILKIILCTWQRNCAKDTVVWQ